MTESAGITAVFREHCGLLVCAEFDADNYDRVTAGVQDWVASQSTKRNGRRNRPRRGSAVADTADILGGAA
jgi:hypothetical protein